MIKTNRVYYSEDLIKEENNRFITRVYAWMSLALIITSLVAYWTSLNQNLSQLIVGNKYSFMVLVFLEFVLVAYLVGWIMKMTVERATIVFILYSVLNGFTMSIIFIAYTTGSIALTFLITAGTFAIMSIYGYYTKSDLTRFGNLFLMGLIGLIIASLINIIYQNETFYWITTYIGIAIFVGLVAYDTQKIKNLNIKGNEGTDADKKEAIIGALSLYLDFINLFLYLLRLFGKRK